MKILLVSSSFYPKIDGSTRCVYDHARKLAERGNEVYLVTRGIPGTKREETFEGIHIRRSSYSFRGGLLPNKIRLMLEQMLMIIKSRKEGEVQRHPRPRLHRWPGRAPHASSSSASP